jgi:hypothetical protein
MRKPRALDPSPLCRRCWHQASSHELLRFAGATLLICGGCKGWPACAYRLDRAEVAA